MIRAARNHWMFLWGTFAWILVVAAALFWDLGAFDSPGQKAMILYSVRAPRVLTGTVIGMALSVAGVLLQSIFGNPLCEPYTLGISSGGAVGAVVGIVLGFSLTRGGVLGSALIGALIFAGILNIIANQKRVTGSRLLLSGVMLGFIGSSLVTVWMALADPQGIQSAVFWLMGDLSHAQLAPALVCGVVTLLVTIWAWAKSDVLDLFLLGEAEAESLGINPKLERSQLLWIVSVLVGMSVSLAGMIGFVGLVIPHLVRMTAGPLHRNLIPASAMWGACMVVFGDSITRFLGFGNEIPVGVVTALMGAPVFIWILLNRSEAR